MTEPTPSNAVVSPGELVAELYAQGVQNIQIKDIDHGTTAAVSFMADPGVQAAVAAVDGKVYMEGPVSANPYLRDFERGAISEQQIRDDTEPAYGPGTDKPFEDLAINARQAGNQLRHFDHGYEALLQDPFDHELTPAENELVAAIVAQDPARVQTALEALSPEQVRNINTSFNTALDDRFDGHGDIKNGAFINVNAQGSETLVLSGALHEKLTGQLAVTGTTIDITVFDSSKPMQDGVIDGPDGKLKDTSVIGTLVYDTHTSVLYDTSTEERFNEFAAFANTLPRDTKGDEIEAMIDAKIGGDTPTKHITTAPGLQEQTTDPALPEKSSMLTPTTPVEQQPAPQQSAPVEQKAAPTSPFAGLNIDLKGLNLGTNVAQAQETDLGALALVEGAKQRSGPSMSLA